MTTQKIKDEIANNLIFLTIKFFLSYIKSFFLTGFILFVILILLFIILNITQDFSFAFLKYFSFINPIYNGSTFTISNKEIIQIFSIVALFFMAIINLIKIVLKRIFKVNLLITIKQKFISFFVINTLLYILAIIIVGFSESLEKNLYVTFIFLYVINLVFILLYFLFDFLLEKFSILCKKQNSN